MQFHTLYFVLRYTSKFGIARFFPYVKICPTLIIRYTVFFVISKFAVERVDCISINSFQIIKAG